MYTTSNSLFWPFNPFDVLNLCRIYEILEIQNTDLKIEKKALFSVICNFLLMYSVIPACEHWGRKVQGILGASIHQSFLK